MFSSLLDFPEITGRRRFVVCVNRKRYHKLIYDKVQLLTCLDVETKGNVFKMEVVDTFCFSLSRSLALEKERKQARKREKERARERVDIVFVRISECQ